MLKGIVLMQLKDQVAWECWGIHAIQAGDGLIFIFLSDAISSGQVEGGHEGSDGTLLCEKHWPLFLSNIVSFGQIHFILNGG